MKLEVYKQLPRARADGICPICRHTITSSKNVCVELHDANHFVSITAECRVLYCATCAIPFANGQLITEVRKKHNGLYFDLFTVNKKCSAAYIESKMKCSPKGNRGGNATFEIEEIEQHFFRWKTPQNLESINETISTCPKCATALRVDFTSAPISETKKIKIPGLFCSKCQHLFVENKNAVDKILRDNPYAKGFTLDGESLWNAAQILKKQRTDEIKRQKFRERVAKLRAIESSVVIICVSFGGKDA